MQLSRDNCQLPAIVTRFYTHIILWRDFVITIIIIILLFKYTIGKVIVNTVADIALLMLNNTITRCYNTVIRVCRSVLHYMVVTVNNPILPWKTNKVIRYSIVLGKRRWRKTEDLLRSTNSWLIKNNWKQHTYNNDFVVTTGVGPENSRSNYFATNDSTEYQWINSF